MFDLTHVSKNDMFTVWFGAKIGLFLPFNQAVELAEKLLLQENQNKVNAALIIQDSNNRIGLVFSVEGIITYK